MKQLLQKMVALVCVVSMLCPLASGGDLTAEGTLPLAGRVIILDPGHGDNGNFYKGYYEGAAMMQFARILAPMLVEQGATVHLTRDGASDVSLANRASITNKISMEVLKEALMADLSVASSSGRAAIQAEIAEVDRLIGVLDGLLAGDLENSTYYFTPYSASDYREMHPDTAAIFERQAHDAVVSRVLFLSLHSNATGTPINESVNGVSVYYVDPGELESVGYVGDRSTVPYSAYFSEMILDNLSEIGFARRKTYTNVFFVNREMNVPSILIENGFHTNDYDRALLESEEFLYTMAEVYVETIIDYYHWDELPRMPAYLGIDVSDRYVGGELIDLYLDVYDDAWYSDSVQFSIDNKIMPPVKTEFSRTSVEYTFAPYQVATWGEVLYALYMVDSMYCQTDFEPVKVRPMEARWHYDGFLWAFQNGLVEYPSHLDDLNLPISVEEVSVLLYQYLDQVLGSDFPPAVLREVEDALDELIDPDYVEEHVDASEHMSSASELAEEESEGSEESVETEESEEESLDEEFSGIAHFSDVTALSEVFTQWESIENSEAVLTMLQRGFVPFDGSGVFAQNYERAEVAMLFYDFAFYLENM